MAIAFGAVGATGAGTTSVEPGFPAGITAGQLLILHVVNKYPTNGPATPAGWTAPANNQFAGGAGIAALDQGNVYSTVFYKIANGTETGTVTVTVASGNATRAVILRYTKAAGKGWSIACAGGSDNTPNTAWSVTAGSDPGITAGDVIVALTARNSDLRAFAAAGSLSATGVTFGTDTELIDTGTTQGDDLGHLISDHTVASGTSSAAPVYTATANGSDNLTEPAGATVLMRLRELDSGTTGAAAGVGTATGVGAADALMTGAAAGVAVATGEASSTAETTGNAAGVATVTGVGDSDGGVIFNGNANGMILSKMRDMTSPLIYPLIRANRA